MTLDLVYLDYNATAPVSREVVEAVSAALAHLGNASAVHRHGRLARRQVEDARDQIAASVGAVADDVIFTSGGTEANNLALNGVLAGVGITRFILSAIEHASVFECAKTLGADITILPCTPDGVADVASLPDLLKNKAPDGGGTLVSIMLVNNETGVIQPVREVTELAHEHGALVLCDAVQAGAKIPVDFCQLDVDLMSLSAHKIGGPEGVGALVVKDNLPLAPWHRGGGQEKGRRAGTENVPGIVGFGRAARELDQHLNDMTRVRDLRDQLERSVLAIAPGTKIFGANAERLPNTSYFAAPGMNSETQIIALDLAGISVSAGSACSSGTVRPSHVLKAMGQSDEVAAGAIRVSLGWNSKNSDVDRFVSEWSKLYARQSSKTEANSA